MGAIPKIPSSEITPEHVYINRRKFMQGLGAAAGAAVLAACAVPAHQTPKPAPPATSGPAATPTGEGTSGGVTSASGEPKATKDTDELGDKLTPYDAVTTYNNYYEFSTDKSEPARLSKDFRTAPWAVAVGGLVNKPRTFGVEDLTRMFPPEERIYRLRCVEAWSMVIPWLGFQLNKLLEQVEPTSAA
jgi:sulfoxide reductase catalytic subunit YedY